MASCQSATHADAEEKSDGDECIAGRIDVIWVRSRWGRWWLHLANTDPKGKHGRANVFENEDSQDVEILLNPLWEILNMNSETSCSGSGMNGSYLQSNII